MKYLTLDSLHKVHDVNNKDSLHFIFKYTLVVTNLVLDHVSFTTKKKITEPYMYVFIKQLPTTNFRNTDGNIGCYAQISLDKIVNNDTIYTYFYKNNNPVEVLNPIAKSLDELTVSFSSGLNPKPHTFLAETCEIDRMEQNEIFLKDENLLKTFNIEEKIYVHGENLKTFSTTIQHIDFSKNSIETDSIETDSIETDGINKGTYQFIERHSEKIVVCMKYS
jgi:hypothetical protein